MSKKPSAGCDDGRAGGGPKRSPKGSMCSKKGIVAQELKGYLAYSLLMVLKLEGRVHVLL